MIKIETLNYQDGDECLVGSLIYSDASKGLQAAVILFPAFEGKSEFVLNYGENLAKQGYTVFVADMYGSAKTASTIEGCFELIQPFLADRSLVRRRALLAFETLKKQPNIDLQKIAAAGFCFGGMCVLELARTGVDLHAGITFHGILAKSELTTHSIKANLLILHGYEDPQAPPENLKNFATEMTAAQVKDWTFIFFGQGKHSFTDPKTGSFNPDQEVTMGREYNALLAERSFSYLSNFLKEQLYPKHFKMRTSVL